MITRIWHGRTKAENQEAYLHFLKESGTNDYRATTGNCSVKIWTKEEEEVCHFWTVTEWKQPDNIIQFAGADFEKARYYPEDEGMLLEFEETVQHYEVYDVSTSKINGYIRQLEQIYHGGNWLQESFDGKLNSLSEDQVFKSPLPGVHSVAELIWHCVYWRRVTLERLKGNNQYRDETIGTQNFVSLDESKKKGWPQLLCELERTQTDLLTLLNENTDLFLTKEYQPGFSYDFLMEGIIQHDAYHLGQVGLVLRMINGKEVRIK